MANVKVTQDKNGVRWLELMRNGSGTLLEIRNDEEALQIISALQQSVQLTGGDSAVFRHLFGVENMPVRKQSPRPPTSN